MVHTSGGCTSVVGDVAVVALVAAASAAAVVVVATAVAVTVVSSSIPSISVVIASTKAYLATKVVASNCSFSFSSNGNECIMNLRILSGFQPSAILQSPEHVQVGCAYIVIALSSLLLGLSKEREVCFLFVMMI